MASKLKSLVVRLGILGVLVLSPATGIMGAQEGSGGDPSGNRDKTANHGTVPFADSDYHVGPGDVIEISVWKEPEASSAVVIRPDGKISVPLINDLSVDGKSPMEIQTMITERLSPFIKMPNVTVSVKAINSKKVFVLGEVARTGAFQITQPTTVLQILTEAGGLLPFARQNSIYVLRLENGKQAKLPFRYKDVVKGERIEQNILLRPGDTVVVP